MFVMNQRLRKASQVYFGFADGFHETVPNCRSCCAFSLYSLFSPSSSSVFLSFRLFLFFSVDFSSLKCTDQDRIRRTERKKRAYVARSASRHLLSTILLSVTFVYIHPPFLYIECTYGALYMFPSKRKYLKTACFTNVCKLVVGRAYFTAGTTPKRLAFSLLSPPFRSQTFESNDLNSCFFNRFTAQLTPRSFLQVNVFEIQWSYLYSRSFKTQHSNQELNYESEKKIDFWLFLALRKVMNIFFFFYIFQRYTKKIAWKCN